MQMVTPGQAGDPHVAQPLDAVIEAPVAASSKVGAVMRSTNPFTWSSVSRSDEVMRSRASVRQVQPPSTCSSPRSHSNRAELSSRPPRAGSRAATACSGSAYTGLRLSGSACI